MSRFTVGKLKSNMAVPEPRPVGTGPSFTGTVQATHDLACVPGEWSGSGNITYAYQWENLVLATGVVSNAAGAGAATDTYTVDAADVGDLVRCKVTATSDVWGDHATYTKWSKVVIAA